MTNDAQINKNKKRNKSNFLAAWEWVTSAQAPLILS